MESQPEQPVMPEQDKENKEALPQNNVTIVDFIRHGTTKYTEILGSEEDKTKIREGRAIDLTPEGEVEVRESAEKIIKDIDPENEVVVLWSSPAWRAQGSEKIVRELLEKRDIQIYKDSEISSMRPQEILPQVPGSQSEKIELFKQKRKEFFDELQNPEGWSTDRISARLELFQKENELMESNPAVKRRAERVFNYIRYLTEHLKSNGKKLHIIGSSHFEFLNPIMEDIFDYRVDDEEGVQRGEGIRLVFDYNSQDRKMSISSSFRGETKSIAFDKEKRRFIPTAEE